MDQNIQSQVPPQGEQMPPFAPIPPQMGMPMRPRRRMTWQQRLFWGNIGRPLTLQQERTFPNWLTGKSIAFFFVAMILCFLGFGYVPPVELWVVASLSVIFFFYGGKSMAKSWERKKEKVFIKNIFIAGFVVRLLWILYCYFVFNQNHFNNTYGEAADVDWYIPYAKDLAQWLAGNSSHTLSEIIDINYAALDDTGYPMWLAIIYFIVGVENDIFIPMLIKCLVSAYCAVCMYRVAKRHFGEGTARMAALFVALNPNLIYWCGTMFKESEMVFLCCVAIDNFDRVLSSGSKFTFKNLLPGVLAGLSLMFFRAALGLVIFLAVFAHIVMASNRVMSMGKKVLAGVLVGAVLLVSMGDRIRTQSQELVERANSDYQQVNMKARSESKGGNTFAKYAGAAVFAPLIFTIPFPTFNQANENQLRQVQLAGGSYIKNIFSFFVILVMFMFLISGEWRRHVFILAYTLGYLMVLVMSAFAQSGRFHMPIWPMLMLFAAYGIQIAKGNGKYKRWFTIALVVEVVACIAWNWFKLKGRGMI